MRLKLYGVPDTSLKKYSKVKKFGDKKFAFDNEPAPEYRLLDQEIATAEEFKDEKIAVEEKD